MISFDITAFLLTHYISSILSYFILFVKYKCDFSYNYFKRQTMKPLKEKISITIDSDLLKDLKEAADKDDRSLSQFINLILRKYIKSKKEE